MDEGKAIQETGSPVAPMTEETEAVVKMDTEEPLNQSSEMSITNGDAGSTIAEVEDSKMDDAGDEDDEFGFYRSEATFSYTVENVHKLTDSVTSPPTWVRGLPWKILVMPRPGHDRTGTTKNLGYFLQCNAINESTSWSCHGSAELRILPAKEGVEMLEKKIDHVFYCKENDWGFSTFLNWGDAMNPEKGYITADKKMTFEVHVFADAPHGLAWDSRKLTGHIGLKNQGATCYMNSLLQTLFFTNKLRKAVYQMPTENDDSLKSVSLALQRVFFELQYNDKPVGTKKLTKSFGWETLDSFMQHDVQELSRVLLDNVELKMKGTCVEGTIPKLLEGKFKSYVKCKNVDYVSSREESFFDIQLLVKGKKNVLESFRTYVKPDLLDGDNKFDAGDYGMQDAEKGIIFKSFPPVLHLLLLRFQYDPDTDMYGKINERYEFPEELYLDEFLEEPDPHDPAIYMLHAILVHRYMLVYIRKNKLKEVLCPVTDNDIPEQLMHRLTEERKLEAYRRKERCFDRHIKILKQATYSDLLKSISHSFGYPINQFRLWLFSQRPNSTWRPTLLDSPEAPGKPLIDISENENPWHVWLELAPPDAENNTLAPFDKQLDILLFLKMYNPFTETISYCGHLAVPIDGPSVADIEAVLCNRGGLPVGTQLQLFEEISAAEVREFPDRTRQLGEVMDKLMDGNIIIFQPLAPGLPNAAQYFLDIYYRVDVLLCDKNDPLDSGFIISLNRNWTYLQFTEKVAERLDTDPMMLQFFRVQSARDMVGSVIRSSFEGQLKDLLQLYGNRKQTKRLYYQQLTMKVDEFETKRQFRCNYTTSSNKEEDIILYPNRNSYVSDLLEECRKKMNIADAKTLRLLEVVGNKIQGIIGLDKPLEELASFGQATRAFRIEIVPEDQLQLNDDEALICTVHFHKEIYNTFGIPALIKVKTGESFRDIRDRIQKSMEIPDDSFEKYKVAVIYNGQVKYLSDDLNITINLKEFMPQQALFPNTGSKLCSKAWIGLDHVNKNSKRPTSRFGYVEKPIKIHN